jgi:rod shape-determining protein MreC
MIVFFNDRQRTIYLHSANLFTGAFYSKYNEGLQYFDLSKQNKKLATENAYLRGLLPSSIVDETMKVDSNRITVFKDTIKKAQLTQFMTFQPVKVINNSISRLDNYLTLESGRLQGVKPGMAVISNDGVVGVVNRVSNHFSLVLSALNRQSRIGGAIKNSDYFGTLVWNGDDPRTLILDAIPKHATINIGDTIVTSRFSTIFPENHLVGRIEKFYLKPGANFYTIEVGMFNDLSRIRTGYVVKNLRKDEQESLENLIKK